MRLLQIALLSLSLASACGQADLAESPIAGGGAVGAMAGSGGQAGASMAGAFASGSSGSAAAGTFAQPSTGTDAGISDGMLDAAARTDATVGADGGGPDSAVSDASTPAATTPLTVFLAGDSTVSTYRDTGNARDQAGWGQMLGDRFNDLVAIENRAIGGATARRFIDENHLAPILSALREGDYVLIQFGTNDGNKTASYMIGGQSVPYYLDPATSFKTYLMQYIDGARERHATPVLVTPPPRNSAYCTGGNGTGAHAQAMRELGASEGVAVVDLNQKTVNYLKAICPSPTPEDFFLLRADGTVDGTHFQKNGAHIMAGFVVDGIREAGLALAAYAMPSP